MQVLLRRGEGVLGPADAVIRLPVQHLGVALPPLLAGGQHLLQWTQVRDIRTHLAPPSDQPATCSLLVMVYALASSPVKQRIQVIGCTTSTSGSSRRS